MNKHLEEWKERYASYRAYRNQYLTTLSLAGTAVLVLLGIALGADSGQQLRIVTYFLAIVILILLLGAHRIARSAITALGTRISDLENEMHFKSFATTKPLESALKATMWGAAVTLLLVVGLFALEVIGVSLW